MRKNVIVILLVAATIGGYILFNIEPATIFGLELSRQHILAIPVIIGLASLVYLTTDKDVALDLAKLPLIVTTFAGVLLMCRCEAYFMGTNSQWWWWIIIAVASAFVEFVAMMLASDKVETNIQADNNFSEYEYE